MNSLKENTAVQSHINILQNIITRMAANSANSKTWAITIISAIVVLLIDKKANCAFFFAYIPLLMFFFLDCFYLGLERHFRNQYNEFVNELENEDFDFKNVYRLQGPAKQSLKIKLTFYGFLSFSTTPFYLILATLIFVVQKII